MAMWMDGRAGTQVVRQTDRLNIGEVDESSDGWTEEHMDVQMDKEKDGWIQSAGQRDTLTARQPVAQRDKWMDRWLILTDDTHRQVDGQYNRQTKWRMDKQTNGR